MKKKMGIALVLAVMIVVAGLTWHPWVAESAPEKPRSAASSSAANRILRYPPGAPQLAFLRIEALSEAPESVLDELPARIAYDDDHTARVSSPVAGRVVRLAAQVGDRVRAGQPLVWLDSPDLGAAIADGRKAEADLHLKQLAFDRAKMLYDGEVLARKDLEVAEAELHEAQAEAQRTRLRLHNLSIKDAGAEDSERFVLRAPIAGVVAERHATAGTEIRPDNPDPLFVVTDPAHLWFVIDLAEGDLGKVRAGQLVSLKVDAYPSASFAARVTSVGAALDPASRRIPVRGVIDNSDGRLRPEMYGRVSLLGDAGRKVMRVPNTALVTEGLYSYVFIERETGVLEKLRVTLGSQGRDQTIVTEGLKPGDRVVTSGALLLNSELSGGGA